MLGPHRKIACDIILLVERGQLCLVMPRLTLTFQKVTLVNWGEGEQKGRGYSGYIKNNSKRKFN